MSALLDSSNATPSETADDSIGMLDGICNYCGVAAPKGGEHSKVDGFLGLEMRACDSCIVKQTERSTFVEQAVKELDACFRDQVQFIGVVRKLASEIKQRNDVELQDALLQALERHVPSKLVA